jgi:fructose-1,6-bisphosphatase II
VQENLERVAKVLGIRTGELTAIVLDRPRHEQIIRDIRQTGARIKLISDGDVAGAIATATEDSGVNILFGIGGSPEAVISAAALKCLGGEIQAKLWPRVEAERRKILDMGHSEADLNRAYATEDMAQGDSIIFCATGITGGDFLPGVRYEENLAITHSVAMRAKTRTVRYITAHHHLDIKTIPSRTEAREIGI